MRKRIVLSLLLLFVLSITGCSSDIYSNQFLINSEIIDEMSIGIAGEEYNVDVDNREQVEVVVGLLKDIKVEELSTEEVQEIFENPDVFINKVNYQITLSISSETGVDSLKGLVYVLEEGKLIFIDPKAIVNPSNNAQIEKTSVYISKKELTDVINVLVEIIEQEKSRF